MSKVVKLVKAAAHAPEVVINPFTLFLTLAVTSVKSVSSQLLESLKQTISRYLIVEERRHDSAWFRSIVPRSQDVANLLTQVISQSSRAGGWDLIGQGLVDLGLALLDTVPPLGHINSRVRGLHHLGSRILLKVVQKQPDTAAAVLKPLSNRIAVNGKSPQYTEALRTIISSAAAILMENPGVVSDLVEDLQRLSYHAARRTLSALLPLSSCAGPCATPSSWCCARLSSPDLLPPGRSPSPASSSFSEHSVSRPASPSASCPSPADPCPRWLWTFIVAEPRPTRTRLSAWTSWESSSVVSVNSWRYG